MAARSSKLISGSASGTGAHPTGGEAGGDIRNCLCGDGGFSNDPSEDESTSSFSRD